LTVLHPDDHDRCRALWESAVREGVMYEATARHRSTAGGYGRFVTRAVPLATEAGEVVGWFGTTTAVESEDDAAGSEAGRTEGASSEGLLAVASHEIRTPLAVLRGTVQLARRRAAGRQLSEEEVRETLESVEQQVDRTLLLVEQLLDHARLGVGRLELNRAACDVTALVRAVVERVTAGNDSHEIDVREAGPVTAEIDAPRIEQVLLNLLDNAIKFSPAGSRIDVRVVRVVSGATEMAEIAVRDRGRGVPTGERSLIFERFHQVTSDDAARGLGMGLAISKEIVELHGGTLAVGTPRGGGARFVVRLPVVRPAE
jgi:signal transduction histidine kinase